MAALSVVILLTVVFGLAYIRVPVIVWSIVIGATLLGLTILGTLSVLFLIFCWFIFIAAALFANLSELRQRYFTKPLFDILQKRMPQINESERIAIEAGNVWWEKDLFCGRPDWKKLLSFPKPTLSPDEQAFLDHQVETLCAMIDDWKVMHVDRDLPENVWAYLKQEKFFVPK